MLIIPSNPSGHCENAVRPTFVAFQVKLCVPKVYVSVSASQNGVAAIKKKNLLVRLFTYIYNHVHMWNVTQLFVWTKQSSHHGFYNTMQKQSLYQQLPFLFLHYFVKKNESWYIQLPISYLTFHGTEICHIFVKV